MFDTHPLESRVQLIDNVGGVKLYLKREDKLHPEVSGNKWRKLRYYLKAAKASNCLGILTYGGAFSNHIAATAAACRITGLSSIGIIRGERIEPLNPTLQKAESDGMVLHFAKRSAYRDNKDELAQSIDPEGSYYRVPEGGGGALGVKGCEEVLTQQERAQYDYVACSAGTGAMAAGLLRGKGSEQDMWVYPSLKHAGIEAEIKKMAECDEPTGLVMRHDYHMGGYAKTPPVLIEFIQSFYRMHRVKLDPIYTAKMLLGVMRDREKGLFSEDSSILAIHSGGIQGARGIELRESVDLYPE